MAVPDLVLDPSLRNWVIFPILLIMIVVGIIRHYVTVLIQRTPQVEDVKAIREQQFLSYSNLLRANGNSISDEGFSERQAYLIANFKKGAYLKDPDAQPGGMNMMTDPKGMESMINMAKGQIMAVVPQTLMMGWINAFFAGFVLMRLPFPLTIRFKEMLQSGVATKDLDVRWVSSISWYVLNVLGLRSVYALLLGDSNSAGGMAAMGANPASMTGLSPGIDPNNLFKAEAENLELAHHHYLLDGIEDRFLNGGI